VTLVVAHRGASAYEVENSLAAVRTARDMGADGVELDVFLTSDSHPVVHHDPVAGPFVISRTAAGDLGQHRLANGEPIPTLAQVLTVLGADMDIFVELKALDPRDDGQLLKVLEEGPAPTRYHVHSFDHRIVRRLKDRQPALDTGVLSASYPVRPLAQLEDAGATTLWQQQKLLDVQLVEEAHRGGARVFAWTVDDPERMQQLLDLGVDALCSNTPDVARSVVG
jgi:glycerophosphoryl diester phosphodiesterase